MFYGAMYVVSEVLIRQLTATRLVLHMYVDIM